MVQGISRRQVEQLLKITKEPEKIFKISKEKLRTANLSEKQCNQILETNENNLIIEKEKLEQKKVKFITTDDENYPKKLKHIYDYPYWLYAKGNISILNNVGISIIGSRNCTRYGENVAKKLATELAKHNINIISGMARGIDTCAHIGCLIGGGNTIAVLGSGFEKIYPKENEKLLNIIIENGGTAITEYSINEQPKSSNFPARNRIISGLCDKLIVVEAGERSGTFITVDFALEQGKEIFAVPGNITSSASRRYKPPYKGWRGAFYICRRCISI